MTTIYLIRHAEAFGNKLRIFHGITDSKLTENGINQAKKAALALLAYDIDAIYSSNLKRACETASYYAKEKGLKIIKLDDLREIDGGRWEDMPWSLLQIRFPKEYHTWENEPHIHQMPGGESMEEVKNRIISVFENIINDNNDRSIAIFTHGTVIRVLMSEISGHGFINLKKINWHENTAITKIIHSEEKYSIEFEGLFDHLDPSQATILNQGWNLKEERA